jgi:hypothetical protein
MYQLRGLAFFCLASISLSATVQAVKSENFFQPLSNEVMQPRSLETDEPRKTLQTPRKRRPYDPVLQPPEKSTTATTSSSDARVSACLPSGIALDNLVAPPDPGKANQSPKKNLTVRMRLLQLKARCKKGSLVDAKGRKIRFYRLIGCWGNPPVDYAELLENQAREIRRLKKTYTVIQISCAQSNDPSSIN